MKTGVAIVGVVLASIVMLDIARAAPSSKFVPPAGWVEDNEGAAEHLEMLRKFKDVAPVELRQWSEPDGLADVQILEIEAARGDTDVNAMIEASERGALNAVKGATQVSLKRYDHPNQIVVEHVVDLDESRNQIRRHYAVDAKGMFHSVTFSCSALIAEADAMCGAALAGFRLLVDSVPLGEAQASASAYRAGEIVGEMLVYVGLAALLVVFVVRAIRKKPATAPKVQ